MKLLFDTLFSLGPIVPRVHRLVKSNFIFEMYYLGNLKENLPG